MAVLAFVLFWIVLALALLFLAMRRGPAARRGQPETRRGNRVWVFGLLGALAVLGVAIPAAVIAGDRNRDSIPEANVGQLTAAQKHGQELFGLNCRQCHTLKAGNAYGVVGPNLDDLRPPKALVLDAINKGRARGNGNMAANLVEGEDAEDVAEFVAVSVGSQQ